MESYTFLREVLGSFGLVLMFVFFVATVIWVLTGRKESYTTAADVIFRHDEKPADDATGPSDTPQETRS
jgi:cytochrome c oxidase cbb3-type subunit 4